MEVESSDAVRFYCSVSEDGRAARSIYASAGIRSTASFVGLDRMGMASDGAALARDVEAVEGDSVELMTHPGFAGEGIDDFNVSPAREHELRVLTALPFDAAYARGTLRLARFADLT